MSERACRDCRYWVEQQALQKTPQGPSRVGLCQRMPPQVLNVVSPQGMPAPVSLYPATQALQWCGEFAEAAVIQP